MITYELLTNRGVVKNTTPLLLEGLSELSFSFTGLDSEKEYILRYRVAGKTDGWIPIKDGTVNLPVRKLSAGLLSITVVEATKGKEAASYPCHPLRLESLVNSSKGLSVYPDTDTVFERVTALEEGFSALVERVTRLESVAHEKGDNGHPDIAVLKAEHNILKKLIDRLKRAGGKKNEEK